MRIAKYNIPSRLFFANEFSIYCVVFVRQDQRVSDMLCDGRAFFPVQTTEGVSLINKSHVLRLEVMSKERIAENLHLFPNLDFYFLEHVAHIR